jgi:hypothetical protein
LRISRVIGIRSYIGEILRDEHLSHLIVQLMLKYYQLIVEDVPNTSELIYTVNKVEILEDWTTALPLRNTVPPLRNTALPLRI